MKKYCYCNGKIMLAEKASVAINDLGLLRGYGAFDFFKTYNGKLFLWTEHWNRFKNSAKHLSLKVPVSEAEAKKIVFDLLKKNKCTEAGFKLFLTGGLTDDGITSTKPNFFILIEDRTSFPPEVFKNGIKVIAHEHQREICSAKNTNYLTAASLQKKKRNAKAVEILFTSRGKVLEGATSNFFIVKKEKIITAKDGVLGGTIRNKVIELARKAGYQVEEREIKMSELWTADEAFLTATNKNITPVVQVDDQKIGLPRAASRGKVGPMTKKLMGLFDEFVAGY